MPWKNSEREYENLQQEVNERLDYMDIQGYIWHDEEREEEEEWDTQEEVEEGS